MFSFPDNPPLPERSPASSSCSRMRPRRGGADKLRRAGGSRSANNDYRRARTRPG